MGVIEVSVHRDDPDPPRTLTSAMLPLAWYLKTQLLDEHGDEWAKAKCKEWYDLEKRYENIEMIRCFCTLDIRWTLNVLLRVI